MSNDVYRAFWRWHFYAGLIVLPFLAWLAVTGGLYLFKPELDRLIYRDWIVLEQASPPRPLGDLINEVQRQTHGTVTQIERPAAANESWRMRVEAGDAARTDFVDPGTGRVLGSTREGGVMKTIRDLHSLVITGTFGNALIEIAAGWAIVLIVTGFVLWWPREGQPAIALRGPSKSRRFWRDLHASTGATVGLVILFLATTGMPWSVFWGAKVQEIVSANGLGRPRAPGPPPWEHGKHGHGAAEAQRQSLPWALQSAPKPHGDGHGDVGADAALRIAASHGITPPYSVSLPVEPKQPYSVSKTANRAQDAHAIYIEASTGKVLQDVRYAQFGGGAKVIEWGIATHQGQEYGAANRWVMLAGCIGILLLVISAPVLWWKRRANGSLAMPPRRLDKAKGKAATATIVCLGILYPLTGATILAVLGLEILLERRKARSGLQATI